jgi:hypothetical protein
MLLCVMYLCIRFHIRMKFFFYQKLFYLFLSPFKRMSIYDTLLLLQRKKTKENSQFKPDIYSYKQFFFCSTLSELENFLLCERILINLTTCQNETSS